MILAACAFFFAEPLARDHSFSFRDTATFYLPRYQWAAEQRERLGAIPLWTDQVGLGAPTLADATAASFYPLQAIFHLPLSAARRMVLYVAVHVFGAALGAYLLARSIGCSRRAATLAALGYAFGGSVLFQHCNVVFLVGAAWLPWSVAALIGLFQQRTLATTLGWSATLAMMVLGGDPQLAYHTVLVAVLGWLLGVGLSGENRWRQWFRSGGLLLAGVSIALALAAVQVLPSAAWSRQSTRAMFEHPRSVYEWLQQPEDEPQDSLSVLLREPQLGHEEAVYRFSVGPWRWMELLWPNVGGRMFPGNHRWYRAIPAEGRTWAPSLYVGVLVIAFAFAAGRMGGLRRWFMTIAVFSLLAALGRYGIGWLLTEFEFAWSGGKQNGLGVGDPVGGVYWLLTTLLPGYVYFRYPAKWLTIFGLAIAILAALGWDRCQQEERWSARILAVILGLAIASLTLAFVLWIATPWLAPTLANRIRAESFFGPFSGAGACRDANWALVHTGLVTLTAAYLMSKREQWRTNALVGLVAVEMCVANIGLMPTAPGSDWSFNGTFAESPPWQGDRLQRIYRANEVGWLPHRWASETHQDPLGEALNWHNQTALPYTHLLNFERLAIVNAPLPVESSRWEALLTAARGSGLRRENGVFDCDPQVLAALGVQHVWAPESMNWTALTPGVADSGQLADNANAYRTRHLPRAYLASQIEWRKPINDRQRRPLYRAIGSILYPDGKPRDFRHSVVLETEDAPNHPPTPEASGDSLSEVDWIEDTTSRIRLFVRSERATCLVISNTFAPGWRAELVRDGRRSPLRIYRANGVMQGVPVPAGDYEVQLRYAPTTFWLGAGISGLAWLGWLTVSFLSISRSRSAEDNQESLDSTGRAA